MMLLGSVHQVYQNVWCYSKVPLSTAMGVVGKHEGPVSVQRVLMVELHWSERRMVSSSDICPEDQYALYSCQ